MLQSVVAEVLEGYGYTVLIAHDGSDAITIAETQPGSIDLLLTDVVMPGMNGQELAETLLASHPSLKSLSSPPAIRLTRS